MRKPAPPYCSAAMFSMLRLYGEGKQATIDPSKQPMTLASLKSRGWIRGDQITPAGRDYLASKS